MHLPLPVSPGRLKSGSIVSIFGQKANSETAVDSPSRCQSHLKELGYPTVPQWHLNISEILSLPVDEQADAVRKQLTEWLSAEQIDVETTAVVVKPAVASSGAGLLLANGLEEIEVCASYLGEQVITAAHM